MIDDDFSPIGLYSSSPLDYYPQATVTLAETTLLTPTSPESYYTNSVREGSYRDDTDEKKPTKKRKSWGQELPTPKTNLPPRKRAKTEDEKEQRRIERVLRNRQAAQSSRERKRQEVEKLEGEKMSIEHQNQRLKERIMAAEHEKFKLAQQLARMAAEMAVLQGKPPKNGSVASNTVANSRAPSPNVEAELLHQQAIKQEIDEYSSFLPSPQITIDPRSSFSSESPSPEYSRSSSPSHLDFDDITTSPDMTQHPAAMLCGLQCQSGAAWLPSIPIQDEVQRQLPNPQQTNMLFTIITHLLCLTLSSAVSSTLLRPLYLIFNSLQTGSPLPIETTSGEIATPMLLHLIQWLILTPANLTATDPSTQISTTTASTQPTTTLTISSRQRPTFRISLLRRLLACSPALARPLKGATGRALQMKTSDALRRKFNGSAREEIFEEVQGGDTTSLLADSRTDEDWPALMTLLWRLIHLRRKI